MRNMGVVYADIELINEGDVALARRHVIGEDEIRSVRLSMLADSGADTMTINETIHSQMEFPFIDKRKVKLASGDVVEYDVVGPLHFNYTLKWVVISLKGPLLLLKHLIYATPLYHHSFRSICQQLRENQFNWK
jgi:hypothetical protein